MEVRDSVYGLINYNGLEEKLLDHEVVQRLRGIKQLALCFLVYPGAVHTRFDHSLGVMHLAGRIAGLPSLSLSPDEQQVVRLAGLLHDIGHGPFSHVSDEILERVACSAAREALELSRFEQFHEAITVAVIRERLKNSIPEDLFEPLLSIFQKGVQSTMRSIVSGPLDADKMDYLLRDSLFIGVKYGVFDLEKVLESLERVTIATGREQLGIKRDGVYAVEQFLLARYHMRVQVYFHRVRRITDAMLVRGAELAVDEGVAELRATFMADGFSLDSFLKSNDFRLAEVVLDRSKGGARVIFENLRLRNLWKEMFKFPLLKEDFPDEVERQSLRELDDKRTRRLERELAENIFKTESEYVIVDKQTVRNPTFRDPMPKLDPESLIVLTKKGEVLQRDSFGQVSLIFDNPGTLLQEWLYVYAPFEGSKEQRKKFVDKYKETVREILVEEARRG